jgi:hypothetical protein
MLTTGTCRRKFNKVGRKSQKGALIMDLAEEELPNGELDAALGVLDFAQSATQQSLRA